MPPLPPENQPQEDEKGFSFRKGKWWPLWSLLLVPFLGLLLPMYRAVRDDVNGKALWLTILVFELLLLPAEWYALTRGHWVYNEARIWGPKVLGIPLEEPLLYYFFPPIFTAALFHFILKKVKKS